MLWNQVSAGKATQGEVFGSWQANKPCIDTRKLEKDDLFVAFRGEHLDGHDYVADALAKGASAAMVEHIPNNVDRSKLLLVKNCEKSLAALATFNRSRLKAKIIGITGSVGKTSTKEAAHLAFSALGETYSNKGNYNNHLGLPITLASIPLATEFVILEMGMSNASEMLYLTKLAQPDIAIITNIAGVHLANFASEEEIAKAKSEIFAGLAKGGAAILNKESKFLALQINEAKSHGIKHILTFGQSGDSYLLDQGATIKASILGWSCEYTLAALGSHHITNSLAILTAVRFLGKDVQQAAYGLTHFKNIKGRGEITQLIFKNKHLTIIDDSYNASPMSMRAALAVLASNFADAKRKVAILADMRELGANEINEHKNLAHDLINHKIDKVIAIGALAKHLYDALPASMQLKHYPNTDQALLGVADLLVDHDAVLIKGSNGTKIYKLIDYFKGQL